MQTHHMHGLILLIETFNIGLYLFYNRDMFKILMQCSFGQEIIKDP